MGRFDSLDTGGGHILVALIIFLIGVGLLTSHVPEGKDVLVGALASLYTSLRNSKGA